MATVGEFVQIIRPRRSWWDIDLREIWAYRELLYFFVWRDIKVRYKQTVIGAAWAILQPFMTMVVFSLFFGKLAKMPSHGLPYPIFYYSALCLGCILRAPCKMRRTPSLSTNGSSPKSTPPHHPAFSGGLVRAGGFRHRLCHPHRHDALLRHRPNDGGAMASLAATACGGDGFWGRSLAFRPQRHLSMFAMPSPSSSSFGCSPRPSPTPAASFQSGGNGFTG